MHISVPPATRWVKIGCADGSSSSRPQRMPYMIDVLPPAANITVSNVPGPRQTLYAAGAELLHIFPVSISTHGLALNITVQTYAGSVDFGVIADARAVPQVQDLTDALVAAFEEGRTLLGAAPAPAPVARATKKQSVPTKASAPRRGTAAKAATVKSPPRKRPSKRA